MSSKSTFVTTPKAILRARAEQANAHTSDDRTLNNEAVIVHQQLMGQRITAYVNLLSQKHPFSKNITLDKRNLLHELAGFWPILPQWNDAARYIWSLISEAVGSITTVEATSNIRLQVYVSGNFLAPPTLLEADESTAITTWNGNTGYTRNCVVPPVGAHADLEAMELSSGIMVICQSIPQFSAQTHSPLPLGFQAGDLYGRFAPDQPSPDSPQRQRNSADKRRQTKQSVRLNSLGLPITKQTIAYEKIMDRRQKDDDFEYYRQTKASGRPDKDGGILFPLVTTAIAVKAARIKSATASPQTPLAASGPYPIDLPITSRTNELAIETAQAEAEVTSTQMATQQTMNSETTATPHRPEVLSAPEASAQRLSLTSTDVVSTIENSSSFPGVVTAAATIQNFVPATKEVSASPQLEPTQPQNLVRDTNNASPARVIAPRQTIQTPNASTESKPTNQAPALQPATNSQAIARTATSSEQISRVEPQEIANRTPPTTANRQTAIQDAPPPAHEERQGAEPQREQETRNTRSGQNDFYERNASQSEPPQEAQQETSPATNVPTQTRAPDIHETHSPARQQDPTNAPHQEVREEQTVHSASNELAHHNAPVSSDQHSQPIEQAPTQQHPSSPIDHVDHVQQSQASIDQHSTIREPTHSEQRSGISLHNHLAPIPDRHHSEIMGQNLSGNHHPLLHSEQQFAPHNIAPQPLHSRAGLLTNGLLPAVHYRLAQANSPHSLIATDKTHHKEQLSQKQKNPFNRTSSIYKAIAQSQKNI